MPSVRRSVILFFVRAQSFSNPNILVIDIVPLFYCVFLFSESSVQARPIMTGSAEIPPFYQCLR